MRGEAGRREAGFTLIESLVALALGAMVVSAVLSTVRVSAAGARRAAVATADAEGFARASVVLTGDADHALAGVLGLDAAIDLPLLPRPSRGLPQAPTRVQYRLEQVATGTNLTRAEGQGPAILLWHADHALAFRFLSADGTWRAEWPSGGTAPRAFALTDPGAESPVLIATLPDLLPAACALGPGADCPLPGGDFQ